MAFDLPSAFPEFVARLNDLVVQPSGRNSVRSPSETPSFTTVPTQLNGSYNEDATSFTVYSTSVDGSGKELKSKHITTWLDESKKKLEVFLVVDAGGKQTNVKLMKMMSEKRK